VAGEGGGAPAGIGVAGAGGCAVGVQLRVGRAAAARHDVGVEQQPADDEAGQGDEPSGQHDRHLGRHVVGGADAGPGRQGDDQPDADQVAADGADGPGAEQERELRQVHGHASRRRSFVE